MMMMMTIIIIIIILTEFQVSLSQCDGKKDETKEYYLQEHLLKFAWKYKERVLNKRCEKLVCTYMWHPIILNRRYF